MSAESHLKEEAIEEEWRPAAIPVAAIYTFEDLCEIIRMQADLWDKEAPTAGEVYDLVNARHHECARAEEHERVVEKALQAKRRFHIRVERVQGNDVPVSP